MSLKSIFIFIFVFEANKKKKWYPKGPFRTVFDRFNQFCTIILKSNETFIYNFFFSEFEHNPSGKRQRIELTIKFKSELTKLFLFF